MISRQDLDHVLANAPMRELQGARIFMSGGTGFVGRWMVESFAHANQELKLDAEMIILTNASRRNQIPQFDATCIEYYKGDVRSFDFPSGQFTHVIHAAATDKESIIDVGVNGTQRMLHCAMQCGAKQFLFTSSGAVYGDDQNAPFIGKWSPAAAYAESKRVAELLCQSYTHRFDVKIARLFTFVGPYLPLDGRFAVGNFIADVLAGRPVTVRGDGRAIHSYMYAADMAAWLWTILLRGRSGVPYNVGSESIVTIAELAQIVAGGSGSVAMQNK